MYVWYYFLPIHHSLWSWLPCDSLLKKMVPFIEGRHPACMRCNGRPGRPEGWAILGQPPKNDGLKRRQYPPILLAGQYLVPFLLLIPPPENERMSPKKGNKSKGNLSSSTYLFPHSPKVSKPSGLFHFHIIFLRIWRIHCFLFMLFWELLAIVHNTINSEIFLTWWSIYGDLARYIPNLFTLISHAFLATVVSTLPPRK